MSGLMSLFSGKKAKRARERKKQLMTGLKEAGKTNKSAAEAYGQTKSTKSWTDMSTGELAEAGGGTLLGGLAGGGTVKAYVNPNETAEKVGRGLGKAINYAINAPGAPTGLAGAADAAVGLAQGKDAKKIALNIAFDQLKGVAMDKAMELAPGVLDKAKGALGQRLDVARGALGERARSLVNTARSFLPSSGVSAPMPSAPVRLAKPRVSVPKTARRLTPRRGIAVPRPMRRR